MTYMHTYTHAYIHTYIHTYIHYASPCLQATHRSRHLGADGYAHSQPNTARQRLPENSTPMSRSSCRTTGLQEVCEKGMGLLWIAQLGRALHGWWRCRLWLRVYAFVCMYDSYCVCMYVCMYDYNHYYAFMIYMHVRIYVFTSVQPYVCLYIFMYVCLHACAYICTYASMYVCMYVVFKSLWLFIIIADYLLFLLSCSSCCVLEHMPKHKPKKSNERCNKQKERGHFVHSTS
jgi:hypothetical protein